MDWGCSDEHRDMCPVLTELIEGIAVYGFTPKVIENGMRSMTEDWESYPNFGWGRP